MDLHSFAQKLKQILKEGPLPGQEAQYIMASEYYRGKKIDLSKITGHKNSAVCLLLFEKEGSIHFLLIKRPDTHTHHAGQLALPGGSCDKGETFEETAIRELWEETGIAITEKNILGRTTPLYIPASNFYIQPIIAYTTNDTSFVESREVEHFIEFALADILDESIVDETEVIATDKLKLKTPYFKVQGFILWGATAMMLSEVKQLLKQHRVTFSFLFQ